MEAGTTAPRPTAAATATATPTAAQYSWGSTYGSGDRRYSNGLFTPGDVRQFRGEVRQYTGQVEQLRRALQGQRMDPRELDEVLKRASTSRR